MACPDSNCPRGGDDLDVNFISSSKDHDNYSTESGMYFYKSDDMSSNYKSQHSSAVNTGSEPIDYNRRIKEHSLQRCASKFSSVTDSSSSCFDSGKSLACESVPSYSKKSNKTSLPLINNPPSNDVTLIGYSYGRLAVPYLSKIRGKNITLRQFKSMLPKKGNFRYFFKRECHEFGTGVIFEDVTEDSTVLPLIEGKIFCVIESMDG